MQGETNYRFPHADNFRHRGGVISFKSKLLDSRMQADLLTAQAAATLALNALPQAQPPGMVLDLLPWRQAFIHHFKALPGQQLVCRAVCHSPHAMSL